MPKQIPACPPDVPKPSAAVERREYRIELITPLFGGGVEAGENDPTMPIRGTSVRGQLQFWWRATRGASSANLEELRRRRILIDGNPQKGEGVLLQIFTQNVIGPIFFEIIERKGNEGFGEGNFRALFESIEQDQIRRGVL